MTSSEVSDMAHNDVIASLDRFPKHVLPAL